MTEFDKFDATMKRLMSVSHDELKKREETHRKLTGKKKKRKVNGASASGHASNDKG
jgi:hypothetical protein